MRQKPKTDSFNFDWIENILINAYIKDSREGYIYQLTLSPDKCCK